MVGSLGRTGVDRRARSGATALDSGDVLRPMNFRLVLESPNVQDFRARLSLEWRKKRVIAYPQTDLGELRCMGNHTPGHTRTRHRIATVLGLHGVAQGHRKDTGRR